MDDYCDTCGPNVRPYVWVEIGPHTLSYCKHCADKYWPRLVEVADHIIDLRHMVGT